MLDWKELGSNYDHYDPTPLTLDPNCNSRYKLARNLDRDVSSHNTTIPGPVVRTSQRTEP
jgi:hypothetical protein